LGIGYRTVTGRRSVAAAVSVTAAGLFDIVGITIGVTKVVAATATAAAGSRKVDARARQDARSRAATATATAGESSGADIISPLAAVSSRTEPRGGGSSRDDGPASGTSGNIILTDGRYTVFAPFSDLYPYRLSRFEII
jgi:hypothetical protein